MSRLLAVVHWLRRHHDYIENGVIVGPAKYVYACRCGAIWHNSDRFERRTRGNGEAYNHPLWP